MVHLSVMVCILATAVANGTDGNCAADHYNCASLADWMCTKDDAWMKQNCSCTCGAKEEPDNYYGGKYDKYDTYNDHDHDHGHDHYDGTLFDHDHDDHHHYSKDHEDHYGHDHYDNYDNYDHDHDDHYDNYDNYDHDHDDHYDNYDNYDHDHDDHYDNYDNYDHDHDDHYDNYDNYDDSYGGDYDNYDNSYRNGNSNRPSQCIFPFKLNGKTYNDCTMDRSDDGKPWCSTKTNRNGEHVSGEGEWEHCSNNDGYTPSPVTDGLKSGSVCAGHFMLALLFLLA